MNILAGIFSWPFGIGVLIGLGLDRTWRYAYAAWLDRRRPLPGNRKRRPPGFNFTALGAALSMAVVVFALYKVQSTASTTQQIVQDARTFSAEVKDCQRQFNQAITARARITTENDELSQMQRTALAEWLHDLLFPPPEITRLDRTGPAYNQWALDLTQHYYGIIADAQAKQDENNRERAAHPLPEPTCGK